MTLPSDSPAQRIAALPEAERKAFFAGYSKEQLEALKWDWRFWARPSQLAPPGNWGVWLILAGRGYGKTRLGAEWVRQMVCGSTPLGKGLAGRIAIVAETAADGRDVMVEGESGLLKIHPPSFRPDYEPSKRRLTWPNGAVASLFNATEPDQLRGPQFDLGWSDELAKWKYAQESWDMLQFGLRLGDNPKQIVTTTPRPIKIVRELLKESQKENSHVVVTRGRMSENRGNLAPSFIKTIEGKYAGTRLGRQELDAEVLDDMPNALWNRDQLDRYRLKVGDSPALKRIVVAVDPAAKSNEFKEDGAATGICVVGMGEDGRGYVLADYTCRESPDGWARRAVAAFDEFSADCIVGEVNQGGDMVASTVRSVRPTIRFKAVHATRGKWVRAEPVSALYEQGRVSHVGTFAALEDEMVAFGPDGMADGVSPDRLDALVWAMTELFPQMTKRVSNVSSLPKSANLGHANVKKTAGFGPVAGRQSRANLGHLAGKFARH